MDETVSYLVKAIEEKRQTHVITANPIMVMSALESADYYRMMTKAELIVPDGAGVVWAANYVGTPVAERVAGFDLMHRLMREGEQRKWTAYLLGTSQEVIETAAEKLQLQYPQVRIVGYRNGFWSRSGSGGCGGDSPGCAAHIARCQRSRDAGALDCEI